MFGAKPQESVGENPEQFVTPIKASEFLYYAFIIRRAEFLTDGV